ISAWDPPAGGLPLSYSRIILQHYFRTHLSLGSASRRTTTELLPYYNSTLFQNSSQPGIRQPADYH
ncbi:MAG: hypothetical protein WCE64_17025, partial [Bacteroidales bacterium]